MSASSHKSNWTNRTIQPLLDAGQQAALDHDAWEKRSKGAEAHNHPDFLLKAFPDSHTGSGR